MSRTAAPKTQTMLMIPDYFDYKLTGVMKQEYTNATSTNLVYAAAKTWDYELIEMLGLPRRLFGELSMPGTVVGNLTEEIQKEVGFDATVILPETHDTGSAFLAVPARDDKAVYLSSGTWSLLGVENEEPICTEDSWEKKDLWGSLWTPVHKLPQRSFFAPEVFFCCRLWACFRSIRHKF